MCVVAELRLRCWLTSIPFICGIITSIRISMRLEGGRILHCFAINGSAYFVAFLGQNVGQHL